MNTARRTVPSIYAIGDVTDRVNLTPVAIREGMAFRETVFNGNPTPVDHALIPTAIFTQPEMGTVGLSEEGGARAGTGRGLLHLVQTDAAERSPGRADRVLMKLIVSQKSPQGAGLSYRRARGGRDDPACGHRR